MTPDRGSNGSDLVGPRLRGLIEGSGRSLRQVAEAAGVPAANLSRICSGQAGATVETIARVLAAVGRRWADLD